MWTRKERTQKESSSKVSDRKINGKYAWGSTHFINCQISSCGHLANGAQVVGGGTIIYTRHYVNRPVI